MRSRGQLQTRNGAYKTLILLKTTMFCEYSVRSVGGACLGGVSVLQLRSTERESSNPFPDGVDAVRIAQAPQDVARASFLVEFQVPGQKSPHGVVVRDC